VRQRVGGGGGGVAVEQPACVGAGASAAWEQSWRVVACVTG
jgi:hypothetical protein